MDILRIAARVAAGLTYTVKCEDVPFGPPSAGEAVGTVTLVRSDGAKVVGTSSAGRWTGVTNETDLPDQEARDVLSRARAQFPSGGGGNWEDLTG